jgi:hypothetical protein
MYNYRLTSLHLSSSLQRHLRSLSRSLSLTPTRLSLDQARPFLLTSMTSVETDLDDRAVWRD